MFRRGKSLFRFVVVSSVLCIGCSYIEGRECFIADFRIWETVGELIPAVVQFIVYG